MRQVDAPEATLAQPADERGTVRFRQDRPAPDPAAHRLGSAGPQFRTSSYRYPSDWSDAPASISHEQITDDVVTGTLRVMTGL